MVKGNISKTTTSDDPDESKILNTQWETRKCLFFFFLVIGVRFLFGTCQFGNAAVRQPGCDRNPPLLSGSISMLKAKMHWMQLRIQFVAIHTLNVWNVWTWMCGQVRETQAFAWLLTSSVEWTSFPSFLLKQTECQLIMARSLSLIFTKCHVTLQCDAPAQKELLRKS